MQLLFRLMELLFVFVVKLIICMDLLFTLMELLYRIQRPALCRSKFAP